MGTTPHTQDRTITADPVAAELGYGCATMGNLYRPMSDAEARDAVRTAWSLGIRRYDTAPHYGLGLSERRLGDFLAELSAEDLAATRVTTKVGRLLEANPSGVNASGTGTEDDENFAVPAAYVRRYDSSPAGIRRSLDESLRRLRIPRVESAYLHDPERYDGYPQSVSSALATLGELRDEGLVRHPGVGSMDTDCLLTAGRSPDAGELMVAGRLTLLDHSCLTTLVPQALDRGLGLVPAAVFNSGILATHDPGGRFDYADAPPQLLERARAIAAICDDHAIDLPTAALHWVARLRPVVAVVIGARTPEQIEENVARWHADVPVGLWRDLEDAGLVPTVPAELVR